MTISSNQAVIAEREWKESKKKKEVPDCFGEKFELYYKNLTEKFPKTTKGIKKIILKNAYITGAEEILKTIK